MKQLLLAGALLHTFSVNSPQPHRTSYQNTLEYNLQYSLDQTLTNQNGTQTMLVYKTRTDIGLVTANLYKIDWYIENWGHWASVVYGDFTKTGNITLNSFHIYQDYTTIKGNDEGYYYQRYGEATAQMETAMENPSFSSLYTAIESYVGYLYDGDERTIETNNGNFTANYNVYNENNFTFMFALQNEDDMFYDFEIEKTRISYTYTYTDSSENEVVDIGGLLWEILAMPFGFISTAFNLTIFPNTPYSINVANILFTLIAALMIIWIVRRFTR